jgi:uncharacterized tellurite resistance protein B-like protein
MRTKMITVLLATGILAASLAIFFFVFHIPEFWAQLLAIIASAFLGAGATAWLTNMLLKNQQASEEEKEKNIKVYEEKLRIYQEFLHCLYEVINNGEVTKEEAIRLEFQTSYITMHTKSEYIKEIAKQVKEIITLDDKNPDEKTNAAEAESKDNDRLMNCLFKIVEQFRFELYPGESSPMDDMDETISAFSTIIDAVDEKEKEKDTEPAIDSPNDLNDILEEFINDLKGRISADENIWSVTPSPYKDGIYVNYAWKGNEEGVRVLLDYEKTGEHFFQIHLDCDDTHEVYKQMKWRFGGRQTKWGWWKYLDSSIRNLIDTREIREHNWEGLANSLADNFKTLLTYVESFERIYREIYLYVPKEKANVRLCYETCVTFDYKKTLGEEKLFIDVVLNENGKYTIVVGNREDNTAILLERLNAIGYAATNESLKNKRYEVFTGKADDVVKKINELNEKIQ